MDTSPSQPPAPNPAPLKDVSPQESTILGIGFAWELGYTIAIPAVLFGIGGGYIDVYMDSSPLYLLSGLAFAFILSFTVIARKVQFILRRMPKTLPKKKKHDVAPEVVRQQEALHDLFRPPTE